MTGRRVEPPQGSRKVPGYKVWMTEDGTPHGPYGRLSVTSDRSPQVSVSMDDGTGCKRSVGQLAALAWIGPKPPKSKLVRKDGNLANNSATNLVWVPNLTDWQKTQRWRKRAIVELLENELDPRHGTRTGYYVGCRCQRCVNAMKIASRMDLTRKTIREVTGEPCKTTARRHC